jgi:hypothetical protein
LTVKGTLATDRDWTVIFIWVAFIVWMANGLFLEIRGARLHPERTDISAYFTAFSVKAERGEGIHDRNLLEDVAKREKIPGGTRPYFYPPPFAEALSVFHGISYSNFRILWIVFSYILLAALFWICVELSTDGERENRIVALLVSFGVFVAFSPIEREIFYGQATILSAVLMSGSILLERRGKSVAAGVVAGIAGLIKVYPVVLLGVYILARRWRVLASAVIAILMVTAISVATFGSHDWYEFVRVHASEGASANRIYTDPARSYLEAPNYSLMQVLYFSIKSLGLRIAPHLIAFSSRIILVMAGLMYFILFRKELTRPGNMLLLLHVILIFFLPSSVIFWNHIFIFLLPGIILIGTKLMEHPNYRSDLFAFWLAGVALMAVADYGTNLSMLNEPPFLLLKPVKFYGLALHAVGLTLMLREGFFKHPVEARNA